MTYTLEQFSAACHQILKADSGRDGRKEICSLLQEVLKDEQFISTHLGDDVPERKVLYEDPELGFCILAHVYKGAKESQPHDHGPSWAIYGQAPRRDRDERLGAGGGGQGRQTGQGAQDQDLLA